MLQSIKHLYGRKLAATDGEIGHIKDLYFDDATWAIRYCVVDTGSWLPGRQVLLSPHAFATHPFAGSDEANSLLRVVLDRKRIENSPPVESHRPVSREHEEAYYSYYNYPAYWQDGSIGMLVAVAMPPPVPLTGSRHHGHNQKNDVHLRSTKSIAGYDLHAVDGQIGSVSDFMVSDNWIIRELLVETGHWYSGKTIALRTADISGISYEDNRVFTKLSREDIARTAKNAVARE